MFPPARTGFDQDREEEEGGEDDKRDQCGEYELAIKSPHQARGFFERDSEKDERRQKRCTSFC